MATGDKYEGDWEGGKKNGKGKIFMTQGCIFLQTEISMKDSSKMETDKEKEHTLGSTKATIEENGWQTR